MQAQESARQQQREQEEASHSSGGGPTAAEQAQALEAVLKLARQAKAAMLSDIKERCDAMSLD